VTASKYGKRSQAANQHFRSLCAATTTLELLKLVGAEAKGMVWLEKKMHGYVLEVGKRRQEIGLGKQGSPATILPRVGTSVCWISSYFCKNRDTIRPISDLNSIP
jgi:hypothetical protein